VHINIAICGVRCTLQSSHIHRNPSHIFSNTQTHLGIKYRNCQANRKKSPGVVGKNSQVAMGESEGEREKCARGRCLSGVPELIIVQGFRRQPAQKRSHSHYYIFTAPSLAQPASQLSFTHPSAPHLIWKAAKTGAEYEI
jgi:hypothetical protein